MINNIIEHDVEIRLGLLTDLDQMESPYYTLDKSISNNRMTRCFLYLLKLY